MRGGGARGHSYVEMLAAIAVVGMAILVSAGLLVRCRAMSARMEERARAAHAAATEMDHVMAHGPDRLPAGRSAWLSGADRTSGLEGARGAWHVEGYRGTEVRRVRLVLEWDGGRIVRETLLGGGP